MQLVAAPIIVALIYFGFTQFHSPNAVLWGYAISYVPFFYLMFSIHNETPQSVSVHGHMIGVIIAQCLLLTCDPILSEDIWRYVWDGYRVGYGANPYCIAPDSAALDQFANSHRLETVRSAINHAHLPTIYPPAAQFIFSFASLFEPSIQPIRMLSCVANIGTLYALYRTLKAMNIPIVYVALVGSHPLFLIETAVSGHVDAFAVFFLMMACLFAVNSRHIAMGAVLGLAVVTKLIPIITLPFLMKRRVLGWVATGVCVAGAYAWFWSPTCDPLGSLSTFSGKWRHNGGLFSIVDSAYQLILNGHSPSIDVPSTVSQWLVGEPHVVGTSDVALFLTKVTLYTLFGLGCCFVWTQKLHAIEKTFCVIALFLLCAPIVHPWYLLWILPALPFTWHRGGFFMTLPLLWWSWSVLAAFSARVDFLTSGTWKSDALFTVIEYVGLVVCVGVAYGMRSTQPASNN